MTMDQLEKNNNLAILKEVEACVDLAQSGQKETAQRKLWQICSQQSWGEVYELAAKMLCELFPSAQAFNQYGIILLNNKKTDDAKSCFEKALILDRKYADAWNNLGNSLKRDGFLSEAFTCYQNAIKSIKDPKQLTIIKINLVGILIDQGDFQEAKELAETIPLKKESGITFYLFLLRIHNNFKEKGKCYDILQALIKNFPEDMISHHNLANYYYEEGNIEKAKNHWLKCHQLVSEKKSQNRLSKDQWSFNHFKFKTGNSEVFDQHFEECHLENIDDYLGKSAFFRSKKIMKAPKAFLLDFTDASIIPNTWQVIKKQIAFNNLTFHTDKSIRHYFKFFGRKSLLVRKSFKEHDLKKPAVLLGGCNNYYHWFLDYLPRLKIIEECPEIQNLPLLVNSNFQPYQKESLEFLGIKQDRLHFLEKETLHHCKKVFVPHFKGRVFQKDSYIPEWFEPQADAESIHWVREKLLPDASTNKKFPKRIFVSRENSVHRRCVNEKQILAVAQSKGFEIIKNESLSLADQIALYAQAECVMGVHGAGFTNMLFAPKNATLIELMTRNYLPRFFENIANSLGQKHIHIPGEIVKAEENTVPFTWDFHINPEDVRKALSFLS